MQIRDFKDKSLSSGVFLVKLYGVIEPRAIDQSIITEGETDEEK